MSPTRMASCLLLLHFFAAAVARECGQEELWKKDLSGCTSLLHMKRIGHKNAVWLGDALHSNAVLEILDLHHTRIGDEDAISLARGLGSNPALRRLAMHNNLIGDPGSAALGGALGNNTRMAFLSMSSNAIGDEGAAALAAGLKANHALRRLDLYVNKVGDPGAIALAAALEVNTGLRMLHVDNNRIGDPGAVALAKALGAPGCRVDELSIAYNNMGNEGARALIDVARRLERVHTLQLGHNRLVHGEVEADAKKLKVELAARAALKEWLVEATLVGSWETADQPPLLSVYAAPAKALGIWSREGRDKLLAAGATTAEKLREHAVFAGAEAKDLRQRGAGALLTEEQRGKLIGAAVATMEVHVAQEKKRGRPHKGEVKDEV